MSRFTDLIAERITRKDNNEETSSRITSPISTSRNKETIMQVLRDAYAITALTLLSNFLTMSGFAQVPNAPQVAAYRTGEWSAWAHDEGVEYRYRWGWNPKTSEYVDAVFQIRNMGKKMWNGAARSLDCSKNTLSGSKDVVLQPSETREVKFRTHNCGTKDRPSFRPNIVKSSRID